MTRTLVQGLLAGFHLACVAGASGAPLACLWLEWREGRGDEAAGREGRRLAVASLILLGLGAVLGALLAATLWSDAYAELLSRFGRQIRWAIVEGLVSGILIVLHAAWWRAAPRAVPRIRAARMALPLIAATNLLYHFPVLWIAVARAAGGELAVGGPLDGEAFRRLALNEAAAARMLAFVWLALAWGGLALTASAVLVRRGEPPEPRAAAWGARAALGAALASVPFVLWAVMLLPPVASYRLFGGHGPATSLAAAAGLLVAALIHTLGRLAFGSVRPALVRAALALALAAAACAGAAGRLASRLPNPAGDPRAASSEAMIRETHDDGGIRTTDGLAQRGRSPRAGGLRHELLRLPRSG